MLKKLVARWVERHTSIKTLHIMGTNQYGEQVHDVTEVLVRGKFAGWVYRLFLLPKWKKVSGRMEV